MLAKNLKFLSKSEYLLVESDFATNNKDYMDFNRGKIRFCKHLKLLGDYTSTNKFQMLPNHAISQNGIRFVENDCYYFSIIPFSTIPQLKIVL